jgi:hypothetical protein
MVDLTERLKQIKVLVDGGKYFVINRARQYGKTTTIRALAEYLKDEYIVVKMDFQKLSYGVFQTEQSFVSAFAQIFIKALLNCEEQRSDSMISVVNELKNTIKTNRAQVTLFELFQYLSDLCEVSDKPIVMMIDEVDSASNNQVFIDFLAQLRMYYLDRRDSPTFHSVILAGVYDIKNLKAKIRPDEERKYNSPWNVAVRFDVDMSFSVGDIDGMLQEYKAEHYSQFDSLFTAQLIYDYTSGYPFLVSRICQILDEENITEGWSSEGVVAAVKVLLKEKNTLFDDMFKKIVDYPELSDMLKDILFSGKDYAYNPDNYEMNMGCMFGFIMEKNGRLVIANRIFETRMYNYFISEEAMENESYKAAVLVQNQFVEGGRLNMELVLEKFVQHFADVYAGCDTAFLEENARRFFLLYLKPIINGTGNYYVEARTRDMGRTDIVVDYKGEQFIIELKIWRGEKYHQKGEQQLAEYLDSYHLDKGYLISFCFNKDKQAEVRTIECSGKTIVEAVV